MGWQLVSQVFSTGMAGIAVWFIWDLIREFKSFKTETKTDIISLKHQREEFKLLVGDAKLVISQRVTSLEGIHNKYNLEVNRAIIEVNAELSKLRDTMAITNDKSKHFDDFLNKVLIIIKKVNERVRKIELENVTIIKGAKSE